MEAREGLSLTRRGRRDRWVWKSQIWAHLLGQVDFEGTLHDSSQKVGQDVTYYVLALLQGHKRNPFCLIEPPRHDVHLRNWLGGWPSFFSLGAGHPTVSHLPLWE